MAGFNPGEPRVPSGTAAGGQWGGAAPVKAAKKTPAKKTAATPKKTAAASGKKSAGTKPGQARNAAAAKAQANPQAQKLYGQLLGASQAQRAAYVKGLSSDDLKLLTQIVYSSRTSDPNIVHARLAVAAEMSRRGIDIKQYGALGGGLPPARMAALKTVAARQVATKSVRRPPTPPKPAPAPAPVRHGSRGATPL